MPSCLESQGWIYTQQLKFRDGKLSLDKIHALQKLGVELEEKLPIGWSGSCGLLSYVCSACMSMCQCDGNPEPYGSYRSILRFSLQIQ